MWIYITLPLSFLLVFFSGLFWADFRTTRLYYCQKNWRLAYWSAALALTGVGSIVLLFVKLGLLP